GTRAFVVGHPLPGFYGDGFGGGQGIEEGLVLLFGEGEVDVVSGAFVVARGEVDTRHVDGRRVDDRGDRVVEGEVIRTGQALEFGCERGGSKRASREDGDRL